MPGIKLAIPTTFTDAELPVLRADELEPAAGALFLLDASHPAAPWPAGVPVNGTPLPNVVSESARELTGDDLTGTVEIAGTDALALERTAKGGLHAMPSPTAPFPAGTYAQFTLPTALADYLHANITHDFYLSQWTRTTRLGYGPGTPAFIAVLAQNTTTYLADIHTDADGYDGYPKPGSDQLIGRNFVAAAAGAAALSSIAAAGWTGAPPSSPADIHTLPFVIGNTTPVRPADTYHLPAVAVYRLYLEDLTVSGRSYAEVDALDAQLFGREVSSPGGRYYGDTYTDPATIP